MKTIPFFDSETFTLTYVVYDQATRDAIVIDPVLDFDLASGAVTDQSLKKVEAMIRGEDLKLHLILETHAHADHLSGSQALKKAFPQSRIAASERITKVQKAFIPVFHLDMASDGADFDYLIRDNEILKAGSLAITAIPTPGHTPACTSFLVGDSVFTGDALFMPDSGTGRCDFPDGSAGELFSSIKRLYELPEETKVFVGHDYQPGGRELRFMTTIGECKEANIHIKAATPAADFISFRQARDKTLKAPRLLYPSLQVNIRAGKLPPPEANGRSYLKQPLS